MSRLKVSDYLNKISCHSNFNAATIFRGVSDYKHGLLPKLFRKNENGDFSHKLTEKKIIDNFLHRFPEMRSLDRISILANMQHYGIPTRILDWTKNFLVALYFSCEKHDEKDGSIYVYTPYYFPLYSKQHGGHYDLEVEETFCDFWVEYAFHDSILGRSNFLDFCEKWVLNLRKKAIYRSFEQKHRGLAFPGHHETQKSIDDAYINFKNNVKNKLQSSLKEIFAIRNEKDKEIFTSSPVPYEKQLDMFVSKILETFDNDFDIANNIFGLPICQHIIQLPHINQRITNQNAISTVHMGKIGKHHGQVSFGTWDYFLPNVIESKIQEIELVNSNEEYVKADFSKGTIFKYAIAKEDKPELREELAHFFGKTKGFIYPDNKEYIGESLYE